MKRRRVRIDRSGLLCDASPSYGRTRSRSDDAAIEGLVVGQGDLSIFGWRNAGLDSAVEEALAHHGRPGIFNTDQGSHFTSPRFTDVLKDANVRISMDGRARWMDNVFIERLWRSLKYECVYLHAFETGSELRARLTRWIGYYNTRRPHSALAGRTPNEAYGAAGTERLAA